MYLRWSYRHPSPSLVSLFRKISKISPRPSTTAKKPGPTHFNYPAYNAFKAFLHGELRDHRALKPGTTLAVFRLMFPEEDKERKFGMQERQLAGALGGVLGVEMGKGGRGEGSREWRGGEGPGCLGRVVGDVVWERNPVSCCLSTHTRIVCQFIGGLIIAHLGWTDRIKKLLAR